MKNSNNNRGFAFIEYHNHACAEYSRQKMMNPKFKLGDNAPTVSWADPRNSDSQSSSQVDIYCMKLPFCVYDILSHIMPLFEPKFYQVPLCYLVVLCGNMSSIL